MFEELGITEVIDRATQQGPEMRIVTVGHAVKAMVLNGLGFLNQQLYLVPHFFQIPPDLVVKSQAIDIIGLILPLIRGQNVVETSRRHMKSRFELLSPSKGNWFTTKSDGMWDFPGGAAQGVSHATRAGRAMRAHDDEVNLRMAGKFGDAFGGRPQLHYRVYRHGRRTELGGSHLFEILPSTLFASLVQPRDVESRRREPHHHRQQGEPGAVLLCE